MEAKITKDGNVMLVGTSWPRVWVQSHAGEIARIGYGVAFNSYGVTFTAAGHRGTFTSAGACDAFLFDTNGLRTTWETQVGIDREKSGTVPATAPIPPKTKPAPPAVQDPYYTDYEE